MVGRWGWGGGGGIGAREKKSSLVKSKAISNK